jgi:hypothetical protein
MARRTFDVVDVTEILVHWHAGRSLNEMSQSLGVDRKTIRKYIAPAVAAGIVPGGPAKIDGEWQDLVRVWFPELSDARAVRGMTTTGPAKSHTRGPCSATTGNGAPPATPRPERPWHTTRRPPSTFVPRIQAAPPGSKPPALAPYRC